jgi:hypothetical protein
LVKINPCRLALDIAFHSPYVGCSSPFYVSGPGNSQDFEDEAILYKLDFVFQFVFLPWVRITNGLW